MRAVNQRVSGGVTNANVLFSIKIFYSVKYTVENLKDQKSRVLRYATTCFE
jgi:hypothetical protein